MIFDTVIEIYQKYHICVHCLGRMFSLLGSYTTNLDRGNSLLLSLTMENHRKFLSREINHQQLGLINLKIIAEKARYLPAQSVLKNEGIEYSMSDLAQSCYLCEDIFSNIEQYVKKAILSLEGIEFNSFLIGTTPDSHIINREDNFKTEFKILEAESFKGHFNRIVGKHLMKRLSKTPEFHNPDVLLIYSLGCELFDIKLNLKSLFIFGRYNKLIRGIPQTHWYCKSCMGKGCPLCDNSGKQYSTSVEELISPEFIIESKAVDSKFHGAGREDIDVRMLGTGRPFILELRQPKLRHLDLVKIEKKINKKLKKKIRINDLRYSNKKEVIHIKSDAKNTHKIYKALVEAPNKISLEEFEEKLEDLRKSFENQEIHQRTPHRVSHRRSDKVRDKIIFRIEGKYIKSNLYEFIIETQGGTYIKELINGDNGRTSPSFSEIFQNPLVCKELDVLEISW